MLTNEEKLKNLQEKHNNRMIFVVGAGSSLHFENIDLLKDKIVIAVNSGLLKVPFCNYAIFDDWACSDWEWYTKVLPKLSCTKLLYRSKLEKYSSHLNKEEIIFFNHKCWYDPSTRSFCKGGLDLTKDPLLPFIGARTTTGTAVHLAYILGGGGIKNPIVLLGIDCCYSKERKRYFWEYPGEKRAVRVKNKPISWFADKGKIKGYPVDYHSVEFLSYWEDLAKATKDSDVNIINCSGGILDVFPRMTLEEVIKKYGEK